MKLEMYQVDAFAEKLFSGNPAAIVPLDAWLADKTMQHVAMENNLAETAFIVNENGEYRIRWFTPVHEVDLCGHATLAAAHVYFQHLDFTGNEIRFNSRSGPLGVRRDGSLLTLDFPVDRIEQVSVSDELLACFPIRPKEAWKGKMDYMLIFENETQVVAIQPDFRAIKKLGTRGAIISAKGDESDFVSRYFAPQYGIDEDPVTGSAHTTLTPYWSKKLDKKLLSAIQVSPRRGYLQCHDLGERIGISGHAVTYMRAEIQTE
jgi:PhzF family phenazine biosynthesis protein